MTLSPLMALVLGGLVAIPQKVSAIQSGDAETMFTDFNNALMTTDGDNVFYKEALNSDDPDATWTGSLDILVAEDAYERTGEDEKKTLVNNLLTTWLNNNAPPWDWDGWNDDIGWFTLALIRGYQITGTQDFLDQAQYGFDYAYGRGWDTEYNDGGIWEENPDYTDEEPHKEALSTNSLGKVSCLIYQSTNDQSYMDKCQQIYDWTVSHLFDNSTGALYAGIAMDGTINTATAAYNQGTFIDFANLVYKITGDEAVYDVALNALNYGRDSLTVNGIFTGGDNYNTWADEMARGVGNFVGDNGLWGDYYDWMVQNADSILENRRSDLGITWNAWDQQTPNDDSLIANKFASAAAWLQYTPETQPNKIRGIHVISNQHTGMAVDSAGTSGNDKRVVQLAKKDGQEQRWSFTPNSDGTWNIVNLATWQALESSKNDADNVPIAQSRPTREASQRWLVDEQEDGSFKIVNKATGKVFSGFSRTDGTALHQKRWSVEAHQRWILE